MLPIERFIKACRNEEVDRPPVWMMRQAGRTLSEYRAVREKYSFWEVCKTPELATEVTMQPLRRFPVDAAVIFSDILVIPDAMGMDVQYTPKLTVLPALKDRSDINMLDLSGMTTKLQYVAEVIKSVRRELSDERAVLGFSGAPYTLACYMIQGEGSKDFIKVRQMMHHDPATFEHLMDILSDAVSDYLLMQNDVSATAVQLFDTWAGELNPEDYKRFVLPYITKIIEKVKSASDLPVIYYINNIGNLLTIAATSGAGRNGRGLAHYPGAGPRTTGSGNSRSGQPRPGPAFRTGSGH